MCGGNSIYKNVVVAATYNAGVLSDPIFVSVPFVPDTLHVTNLSFYHTLTVAAVGDLFNIMCDLMTSEPLAQIPVNGSNQRYCMSMDGMHVLANYSNGQYVFRLASALNGAAPTAGIISFALNLMFTKKLA